MPYVADDAGLHAAAAADYFRPKLHLTSSISKGLQPHYGVITGGEADERGHADIEWIVVLDVFVAAQGVNYPGIQPARDSQHLVMRRRSRRRTDEWRVRHRSA